MEALKEKGELFKPRWKDSNHCLGWSKLMAVKMDRFSENTAKRVAFSETQNTLFRILSSIVRASVPS